MELDFDIESLEGNTDYVEFEKLENRIKQFPNYKSLGKDVSGKYDFYQIDMGTKGKPIIIFDSIHHGHEYQSAHYLLGFLENLRDGEVLNQSFIDDLLDNFHLIAFPVMNPWGVNKTLPFATVEGRHPFHGDDIDADYDETMFNTHEARLTRYVYDDPNAFANIDLHLYRKTQKTNDMIYGIGDPKHNKLIDDVAKITGEHFPNKNIGIWRSIKSWRIGRVRSYFARHRNLHTEATIAFKIELARPSDEPKKNVSEENLENPDNFEGEYNGEDPVKLRPNSSEELYKMGYLGIYLYVKKAMEYYHEKKGTGKYLEYTNQDLSGKSIVNNDLKESIYVRDAKGQLEHVEERFKKGYNKGKTIKTNFVFDEHGFISELDREFVN